MNITLDNTLKKIRKYKEIIADIGYLDIRIQELEEEILGISGQGTEERTGKTYKITSSVEQQAEKLLAKKEELYREQMVKKRELKRIDNALNVLTDEEKEVIEIVHLQLRKYYVVQEKLYLSYQRVKQLERQAADKMKKYIL